MTTAKKKTAPAKKPVDPWAETLASAPACTERYSDAETDEILRRSKAMDRGEFVELDDVKRDIQARHAAATGKRSPGRARG